MKFWMRILFGQKEKNHMVTMLESSKSESSLTFSAPNESRSIYLHRLWTDLVKTLLIYTQCEFKAIMYYN